MASEADVGIEFDTAMPLPPRRHFVMANANVKLPPQILYPLLQQQLAKFCRQGVIDAVDLFDLQLAIEICEAEMGIDRRPS